MRTTWIAIALLTGGATAFAPEGWKYLDGEAVPAISAEEWLNTNGENPDIQALRGKLWLLEFFATW